MPFLDKKTQKFSGEGLSLPRLALHTWKWNYTDELNPAAKTSATPTSEKWQRYSQRHSNHSC